jgi:sugar lactone lactonase YvrE
MSRLACGFGLVLLLAPLSWAETLVLVAGGDGTSEPVKATEARLTEPFSVDFNAEGTLFFVEMTGERIRAIDAEGVLRTIGGNGEKGNTGDGGPVQSAQFHGMHNLIVAPNGDLLVADTWNHRIRRVDAKTGIINAYAGTGEKGFGGDGGPAIDAQFGGVYCLAQDPSGEHLYIADLDNRRIRAIDVATGIVTTIAGNGKKGVPSDGAKATEAPLVDPRAVAADDAGNVYILERSGDALRVVDAKGVIRTVIDKEASQCLDETGARPRPMKGPKHLCIDPDGNVIIADTENHVIRKYIPSQKKLTVVAGSWKAGNRGLGGPPQSAQLDRPHGVYVNGRGVLYIADSSNGRIVCVEDH